MAGIQRLLNGYQRFRELRSTAESARWKKLAEGQNPSSLVIACCDSRVEPAIIFDADPGDIFVVRNVANLVPPFETGGGRHGVSAALEFAVTQLGVGAVVVMGHERCGGIQAALTGQFKDAPNGEGGFISHWMSQIDEVAEDIADKHGTGEDAARRLEEEAIRQSLVNLRTFPFVQEREAAGTLRIAGCHFSIGEGSLEMLDEESGTFRTV